MEVEAGTQTGYKNRSAEIHLTRFGFGTSWNGDVGRRDDT